LIASFPAFSATPSPDHLWEPLGPSTWTYPSSYLFGSFYMQSWHNFVFSVLPKGGAKIIRCSDGDLNCSAGWIVAKESRRVIAVIVEYEFQAAFLGVIRLNCKATL